MSAGITIGEYDLLESLGAGGMATVYRGYHRRLKRPVAIKMIHQAYQDDRNFLARFQREAEIVASLDHPNIVPVYDFSEYNGQPYLVMKLIDGSSLKSVLTDGPIALPDILLLLRPIASALDYAHARGVLHRDIKPSNIMVDQQVIPYLMDFGLARIAHSGETTLSAEMLIGTPNYMSPEQAQGDAAIDKRSDLYSLGVVLYELLVGQVPYSGGTPYAIIHDHIYKPLPAPRSLNPDIPLTVEGVLFRALAKLPDDRYQSATAMIEALLAACDESGLRALNPDRRHTIALSLAKPRPATATLIVTPLTNALSGVAQPAAATPAAATAPAVKTRAFPSSEPAVRQRRGGFLVGLLVGIGVLSLVLIVVFSLRRNGAPPLTQSVIIPTVVVLDSTAAPVTAASIAAATDELSVTSDQRPTLPPTWTPEPTATPFPATATNRPAPANPTNGNGGNLLPLPGTPGVGTGPERPPIQGGIDPSRSLTTITDIPRLSAADAQAALNADPNNPLNYLVLARAQYAAAQPIAANQTLVEGLPRSADPLGYKIMGARAAGQEGYVVNALSMYASVMNETENAPIAGQVRDIVGLDVYRLAENTGYFDVPTLLVISNDPLIQSEPVVAALVGHSSVHGRLLELRATELRLQQLLLAHGSLPEIYLILGELRAAEGDNAAAVQHWETARTAPGAPNWLITQTRELTASIAP